MNARNVIEITADIVTAHVSNNAVAVNELPNLIREVHAVLISLGYPDPVQSEQCPAGSTRSSVNPDHITCGDALKTVVADGAQMGDHDPGYLLRHAEKCRQLATAITDLYTCTMLNRLATDLELRASQYRIQ